MARSDHGRLPRRGYPLVQERKHFGQAIGEFQLVQGKLAILYVTLNCLPAPYVYGGRRRLRPGRDHPKDSAGSSSTPPKRPPRPPFDAIQLLAMATQRLPDRPLLRDAKPHEIGAGTSENPALADRKGDRRWRVKLAFCFADLPSLVRMA